MKFFRRDSLDAPLFPGAVDIPDTLVEECVRAVNQFRERCGLEPITTLPVVGVPGSATSCPLARALVSGAPPLEGALRPTSRVDVSTWSVVNPVAGGAHYRAPLPACAEQFLARFDNPLEEA